MGHFTETLPAITSDQDTRYAEAVIRENATEVIGLAKDGLLAVRIRDEFWVEFAVFEWALTYSESNLTEYNLVMHGDPCYTLMGKAYHRLFCCINRRVLSILS